MQLLSGPVENIKPLNVGILMFSEQPERYFRYARIEVVDIPDPTGTNMVEKVFTGPIQRQLKDALAYIKNYILKEAIMKESDKADCSSPIAPGISRIMASDIMAAANSPPVRT